MRPATRRKPRKPAPAEPPRVEPAARAAARKWLAAILAGERAAQKGGGEVTRLAAESESAPDTPAGTR